MNPKRAFLAVAVVLLASTALASLAAPAAQGAAKVMVVLGCNGQNVSISVNPFHGHAEPGETFTWRGVGGDPGPFMVVPTNPAAFPWDLSNGGTSDADRTVTATPNAKMTEEGDHYYRVQFDCNGPKSSTDPVRAPA